MSVCTSAFHCSNWASARSQGVQAPGSHTVKKHLRSEESEPKYPRRVSSSKLNPYAKKLTTWLVIDATKSRKQRRTLRQIHTRSRSLPARNFVGKHKNQLISAGTINSANLRLAPPQMFAFTEVDKELLRPTTGRDPLGVLSIWQHRARDLVPHLTASSGQREGFYLLLTALAWWPQFAADQKLVETRLVDYFMLIEQAVARACRLAGMDWPLPGSRNLNSNASRGVYIGTAQGDYLLDSQASNGVWGLYRQPAISAGLIGEDNRITAQGGFNVDAIRKHSVVMGRLLRDVAAMIKPGAETPRTLALKKSDFVRELCGIVATNDAIKPVLQKRLLKPATPELTTKLAKLIRSAEGARGMDSEALVELAIGEFGAEEPALQQVMHCERYLAVAEAAFACVCATPHAWLRQAAGDLHENLDMGRMRGAQGRFRKSGDYGNGNAYERYISLANLNLTSPDSLITDLIEHHRVVSEGRGVEPWVSLQNGKFDFLHRADAPDVQALDPQKAWRNSYYLRALQSLVNGLHPALKAGA